MEPLRISSSVGHSGVNDPIDVEAVQRRLNSIPLAEGGAQSTLDVDGLADQSLVDAISGFQDLWALPIVDGRIDPSGATVAKINDLTTDTCGDVNAFDLALAVAQSAQLELDDWSNSAWTETNPAGLRRVHDYWSAVAAGAPASAGVWSAVFVSYLVASGYMLLHGIGDIGDFYGSSSTTERRKLIDEARRCVQQRRLFAPRALHIEYVRATLGFGTATVESASSRVVDIADFVLNGRSGNTYAVSGNTVVRNSGTGPLRSHVDVVVDISDTVEGVPVASLIGGNTLPGSTRVGMKMRPLSADGSLIQPPTIPPAIQLGIDEGRLNRVGTTEYYQIAGRSSYEMLQLGKTDVIMTLR